MITTIGVYATHGVADATIKELKDFGISGDDISYLYVDQKGEIKDEQAGTKIGAGAAVGAGAGAVIGAIAGLVVANGVLPGLGSLFVAGPLAAALGLSGAAATTVAGAATGAAAGGLIGALASLGVDKEDARLYEDLVRGGDALLVVRSNTEGAKAILERAGAKEIREYRS